MLECVEYVTLIVRLMFSPCTCSRNFSSIVTNGASSAQMSKVQKAFTLGLDKSACNLINSPVLLAARHSSLQVICIISGHIQQLRSKQSQESVDMKRCENHVFMNWKRNFFTKSSPVSGKIFDRITTCSDYKAWVQSGIVCIHVSAWQLCKS